MAKGLQRQLGVVDQCRVAFRADNRLATVLGFVLGGIIPIATYVEAHFDIREGVALYAQVPPYLVLGGLIFSAKTVFAWLNLTWRDSWKAVGTVAVLEGVMITSDVPALPLVLLTVLVAINGIATGCTLSLDSANAKHAPVQAAPVTPQAAPLRRERAFDASGEEVELASGIVTVSRPQRRRRSRDASQKLFSFVTPQSEVGDP